MKKEMKQLTVIISSLSYSPFVAIKLFRCQFGLIEYEFAIININKFALNDRHYNFAFFHTDRIKLIFEIV